MKENIPLDLVLAAPQSAIQSSFLIWDTICPLYSCGSSFFLPHKREHAHTDKTTLSAGIYLSMCCRLNFSIMWDP